MDRDATLNLLALAYATSLERNNLDTSQVRSRSSKSSNSTTCSLQAAIGSKKSWLNGAYASVRRHAISGYGAGAAPPC
jgi:hypothetical protein